MSAAAMRRDFTLRGPIAVSAALHLAGVALFLVARGPAAAPMPPIYRVSLIAAPPGPRQVGEVQPAPKAEPPPVAETPPPAPVSRSTPDPARMKALNENTPKKAPKVATPNVTPPKKAPARSDPAPVARGGPTGGRGADVANVTVDGIDFKYPGYLENVVRQIAIRFKPPGGRALTAVVAFLIRRDGSVTGIRLTTRSGVYSFDTEAMGAVDAAANARAFGPLPQGFTDDVLPVIFSFDPRLIH